MLILSDSGIKLENGPHPHWDLDELYPHHTNDCVLFIFIGTFWLIIYSALNIYYKWLRKSLLWYIFLIIQLSFGKFIISFVTQVIAVLF